MKVLKEAAIRRGENTSELLSFLFLKFGQILSPQITQITVVGGAGISYDLATCRWPFIGATRVRKVEEGTFRNKCSRREVPRGLRPGTGFL